MSSSSSSTPGTQSHPAPCEPNPCECPPSGVSASPVRYFNGEIQMSVADLSAGGFGLPWGHTRSYNNQLLDSAEDPTSEDFGNGYNWMIRQVPYLVDLAGDDSEIQVAFGPNHSYWFDLVGAEYVARYGALEKLDHDGENDVFHFTQTDGTRWTFYDFDQVTEPQGGLQGVATPGGQTLALAYNLDDRVDEVQRAYSDGASTTTESFLYAYLAGGDNDGRLESVTLRRKVDAGAWEDLRRTRYTYYGSGAANGSIGDLQTAVHQLPDGAGGWTDQDTYYYRYYQDTAGGIGFQHGLKYALEPAAYQRLADDPDVSDPLTATDAQVAAYADFYFEYDSDQRVTKETVEAGARTLTFAYTTSAHADGYNNWRRKTVETLPDESQNVVYTNYIGQVLVREFRSGSDRWIEYRRYDEDGRLVLHAQPSACEGYDDTQADLGGETGVLRTADGLVHLYEYYGPEASSSGEGGSQPEGYKSADKLRQGRTGDEVLVAEYVYTTHTDGDITVHPLAEHVTYRNDDGTGAISTEFGYTFHAGTVQPESRTATLPAVPADQNGQNVTHDTVGVYDEHGNLTWSRSACGAITRHLYDIVTGARTQTVEDVDTEQVDDEPAGWTTVSGWGKNLTTDFEHDDLGRTTQTLGPLHDANGQQVRQASWTVYQDADQETWSASGYAVPETDGDGYDSCIVGPVSISRRSECGCTSDQIAAVPSHTVGRLTGDEEFPQSSWCRWSRSISDDQGRVTSTRAYHTIPSEGDGLPGTNYDETTYAYDSMRRQNKTTSPGGTITRTVFNARGRAIRTYTGTCDTGATETDPTGNNHAENNMVLVTETHYDHGDGGDGLLTRTVEHVDNNPLNSRATLFSYDCRNRLVTTDGELDFYRAQEYDNLGRVIQVDQHDTTAAGNLVGRSETSYDDRGQVYQTIQYAVNVETGEVTGHVTSNTWYDASGRPIKEKPGGSEQFTKTTYDGLGRAQKTFVGYDTDETSYDDAVTTDGDTIFEQEETEYAEDGSVIKTIARQRIHDATGTGELQDPSTEPRARLTYTAAWYDAAGRQVASADYGTNDGETFTRPDTVPDRSDTVLVTSTDYNTRGEAFSTIDPAGREDRTILDDAGRTIETIENFSCSPLPSAGEGLGVRADQNKTTRLTYTPDGQTATLTAVNPTTGDQTTRYVYGTTLADAKIARSDLLRAEIYPDSDDTSYDDGDDTTYDRVEYGYSRQGEVIQKKDQNGTVHWYEYDKLGQNTHAQVNVLGAGVDGGVRRLSRTYGVAGRLEKITSYSHPFPGTGTIVNQVLFEYNDSGMPSAEYQSHSGAVDVVSTPKVQYAYDDTLDGDELVKGLRPTQLIYPNGRIVRYEYAEDSSSSGTGDDPDDLLNRIKFIADDDEGAVGTHLAEYTRLGLDSIVQVDYAEPQIRYDLAHGSGDDPYAGLDRFGRVADLLWDNYNTAEDVVRIRHGYDRAGNRLYREDPVAAAHGVDMDEAYTYDGLYQLKTFTRGALNAQKTAIAAPTFRQAWDFDTTGNWTEFREDTDGDGKWELDQTRTHNPVNEITDIDASIGDIWISPTHDRNGSTLRIPQPNNPSKHFTLRWDAWNRLVKVSNAERAIAEYAYDARNFRVLKQVYRDPNDPLSRFGSPLSRHFYHNSGWQCLEERLEESAGLPKGVDRQFVWGLRYIDDLLLRDRDVKSGGDLGKTNSGLDERLYALQDPNWNVVAMADLGVAQERLGYDAYGKPLVLNGSFGGRAASNYDCDYRYTGRRFDHETALMYFRNRNLVTQLGRFSHRDPIGYLAGINVYPYVGNGPLMMVDPSGNWGWPWHQIIPICPTPMGDAQPHRHPQTCQCCDCVGMVEVKIQQILWAHVRGWNFGHCGLHHLVQSLREANRIWYACCIAFTNKEEVVEKSVEETKDVVSYTGWIDMDLLGPGTDFGDLPIAKHRVSGAIPAHYICGFKYKTQVNEDPRVGTVTTRKVQYGQGWLSPPLVVVACHNWRLNTLADKCQRPRATFFVAT